MVPLQVIRIIIRISNVLFATIPMLSGASQGSILDSILFLIFMNDLFTVTTAHKTFDCYC